MLRRIRWKTIILHIFFPLLLGFLIYLLFRTPYTYLHSIFALKKAVFVIPRNLPGEFVLFYLPDMCWAYALTASLIVFTRLNKFWCATIGILAMSFFEFMQADFVPGNLDLTDIVLMLLAVILSIVLIKKK